MNKKIIVVLFMVLSFTLALSGCSNPQGPTSLETVDKTGMNIVLGDGGNVTAEYDSNVWEFDEAQILGAYTIYYKNSQNANELMNINYTQPDVLAEDTTASELLGLFEASFIGYEISNQKVYTLGEYEVVYMETLSSITDTEIDLMLEQGMLTEADIESYGGREALKAIPPATQVFMSRIIDGKAYSFVGTYYSEEEKEILIDGLTLIMETLKVTANS